MKGRQVVLDKIGGRSAAALLVDGQLDDFLIDPASDTPLRPGAIFRGICQRPMKGQGGMFIDLGEGRGFLRQAKGLAPGQPLLVQLTGWAEDGKAPGLAAKVLFKSRYAIVTPEAPGLNVSRSIRDDDRRDALLELAHEAMEGSEHGLILRSVCADADEGEIAEDILAMRDLAASVMEDAAGAEPQLLVDGPDAHLLAWRDWDEPDQVDDAPGSFAALGVDEMIEAAQEARQPLGGGAYAFVEPTRALVAVDVNTGADGSPAAGLKANLALARALPRLLRCRGLGGQITLDLAPMPKKDRRGFETALRAAFKRDGIETVLAGWTPLGHYELQRKRDRLPVVLPGGGT